MRSFLEFSTEKNEVVLVDSGTLKFLRFNAFFLNFCLCSEIIFSVTTDNLLLILVVIDLLVTSAYIVNLFFKFFKLVSEFTFKTHKVFF